MPVPNEYRTLVTLITMRTNTGKLDWKAAKDTGTYFVALESASISIGPADPFSSLTTGFHVMVGAGSSQPPLRLVLYDREGKSIDWFRVDVTDREYGSLYAVWRAAHRQVLNVDSTIARITNELEGMGEGPPTDENEG